MISKSDFVFTTSYRGDCLGAWYDHSFIEDEPPSQHGL